VSNLSLLLILSTPPLVILYFFIIANIDYFKTEIKNQNNLQSKIIKYFLFIFKNGFIKGLIKIKDGIWILFGLWFAFFMAGIFGRWP